ncbi:AbrB/MazE/SpoVT family DNA-binding domain-containing protein [Candidatus Woesearchaeota archaeon]|nr:AbrB/MazE/SpoVT family DNA-binding domain-containing protein [Candidatus Woesearchaeota archaeon]
MRRKLIQQGNSALTITLPAKWVKKNGLKAGDEIEVREKENKIEIIKEDIRTKKKEIEIQIKDMMIGTRFITALYRGGYDKILINYSSTGFIRDIQKTVQNQLFGFEITQEKAGFCVLEDLSGEAKSDVFRITIKQCLNLADNLIINCVNEIKNQQYALLKNLKFRDLTINRFTNYCTRILNKNESLNPEYKLFLYHFIRKIESYADKFEELGYYIGKNKIQLETDLIGILYEIKKLSSETFQSFFSFDHKNLNKIIISSKELEQKTVIKLKKYGKADYFVLQYIYRICQRIRKLISSIIEINFTKSD